ncbi:hypothetical protein VKT23_010616 [Stygiomarasmius scandens]|uniref:Uncharacterized protein n=1 Tax=Marasmiellus scandens TaxID=2682957 RepID=A0ABR1JDE6_9AGAR
MRVTIVLLALSIVASAAPQRSGRGRGRFGNGSGFGTAVESATGAAGATDTADVATATNAIGTANSTGSAGVGAANNAGSGAAAGGDLQSSTTLDPSVIATGFANDGNDKPAENQSPSKTSTNNFINFCATRPDLKITNGQQIPEGSCNPAPMGLLPSKDKMPSSKFVFPKNNDVLAANQSFTVQMAVRNIQLGNFVNALENYYSAPQFLNDQGLIIGHSHVTIDPVASLTDTNPTDPESQFVYFKGINTPQDANGIVSVTLDKGLPPGVYRLASINAAANHQPVLAPIAQHGSMDDMVYFMVSDDPTAVTGNGGNAASTNGTAGAVVGTNSVTASTDSSAASAAAVSGAAEADTGKGRGRRF